MFALITEIAFFRHNFAELISIFRFFSVAF